MHKKILFYASVFGRIFIGGVFLCVFGDIFLNSPPMIYPPQYTNLPTLGQESDSQPLIV